MQPKVRESLVNTPLVEHNTAGAVVLNLPNARDLLRRFLWISGFALFAVLAPSFPVAAETDPAEFIDGLGNQTLQVIRGSSSLHQKQTRRVAGEAALRAGAGLVRGVGSARAGR